MRSFILVLVLMSGGAYADNKVSFSFKNADIAEVLATYAKASSKKIIVDPIVRGKITIINPEKVSVDEAFAQLSTSLAVNGLAFSKQDDVLVVQQARNIQRNLVEVGTTLPPLRPEKMFTWVVNLKYVSADEINSQLRILSSKDGELVPVKHNNQLIMTDWVSNLYRVQKILAEVDKPAVKR